METSLLSILAVLLLPDAADSAAVIWAKRLLSATAIFAAFWFLAQLMRYVLEHYGARFANITKTDLDNRILKRISPGITMLVSTLGIYVAISTLPLSERFFLILSNALFVLLVLMFAALVYHLLDELFAGYLDRLQYKEGMTKRNLLPLVRKLSIVFLCSVSLVIILKKFNYDVMSLLATLGLGTLAIGLAAKDTLSQLVSGLILLIDRPFRIGDRIRLANGQVGDVQDIGLRSTKLLATDSTVMIIPNSDLCNSVVVNMVRPTPAARGQIELGVGYDTDIDAVKIMLKELAADTEGVLAEPAPVVQFVSFGDSALELQLFFWVATPARLSAVTDQLNSAILRKLREENIDIPFPARTIYLQQNSNAVSV